VEAAIVVLLALASTQSASAAAVTPVQKVIQLRFSLLNHFANDND